jgi:imidazolonepropionase-like amidohydrolase
LSEPGQYASILIRNVRIFDGVHEELVAGQVLTTGSKIAAVVIGPPGPYPEQAETIIDGGGRVLIPGLTDAHVHITAAAVSAQELMYASDGLVYLKGIAEAGRMLMRGFTAVRDMAGDTAAIKQVIDSGLFPGPRIYPSHAAISQTSGHGDFSAVFDAPRLFGGPPSRAEALGLSRVVDGREGILAGVREQLKKEASQIKVMAGGGVASGYDPLDVQQFTPDELRAAVEAAQDWGTYVAAHVYTAEGIRRAVAAGVKSIEHGHLADEESIALLADSDVWLSTQAFVESDHPYTSPALAEKNRLICEGVDQAFDWARKYGVKTAFGTDLLLNPATSHRQSEMLTRLARHFSPAEALTMVTSGNAGLFRLSGARDPYREAAFGVIEPGAWADMLIVEGDPTKDLAVFGDPELNLAVIIKDGQVYKNRLSNTSV